LGGVVRHDGQAAVTYVTVILPSITLSFTP